MMNMCYPVNFEHTTRLNGVENKNQKHLDDTLVSPPVRTHRGLS